jgi:hypothetical protein
MKTIKGFKVGKICATGYSQHLVVEFIQNDSYLYNFFFLSFFFFRQKILLFRKLAFSMLCLAIILRSKTLAIDIKIMEDS